MRRAERNLRRRVSYHLRQAMRACVGVPIAFDGCVMFQADVYRAATGIDPMARWRGRYTTVRGMRRVMGRGGLLGALSQASKQLRCPRIDPNSARVGDFGLVKTETGMCVVRMLHRDEWIGRSGCGYAMVRTSKVRIAWALV